jgi:hypothetical protein
VGDDLHVRQLSEQDLDEWVQLVGESRHGSVYALPAFLESLCRAAGGRYLVLGASRAGRLEGGVALYENDSIYGRYVSSRPLLYYNGPVLRPALSRYPSEQTALEVKILTVLAHAIATLRYARARLACSPDLVDVRPFLRAGWLGAIRYTYFVGIGDLGQQWAQVEHNLRRLVRRGERDGLSCVEDDDVEPLCSLHAETMARKGGDEYLPPGPFRIFLKAIQKEKLGRVFHARLRSGQAIASQLVLLSPGGLCHVAAAAADGAFLRTGASAFLRWRSFESLSADGFRTVDLTDAPLNAVTHFKSQLGGDLRRFVELNAPVSARYRMASPVLGALRRARFAVGEIVERARGRNGDVHS